MVARDVVCGMDVDTETAVWKSEYNGQSYYFCSPGCKRDFDRDPARYVSGAVDADPGPAMRDGG